jgi:lactate dehydrogenase-like 2-hydroxyacid dehydrogenase
MNCGRRPIATPCCARSRPRARRRRRRRAQPGRWRAVRRLPKLEVISSFGVGYDHVDAAEAGRRGLTVTNTPDVLTDEVADLALGLLIATVRQLPQVDRYLREGKG